MLSSCPSGKISFAGLCCITGPCTRTQRSLLLLRLDKGAALSLIGNLLAQVSSDLCILVHLTCNHLSDLGSGEGGISESSSCLAKSFTNGKSFNSKSFQTESEQGPGTVIFVCCCLRPDA